MRRRAILFVSAVSARRGLAYVLLVVVNAVHALVHGTPLDGGSLDATVAALDTWAINAIVQDAA